MSVGTEVESEVVGNTKTTTSYEGMKKRAWFFTLNNPTEGEKKIIDTLPCIYSIYQLERGENGTLHYQGVLYYKNPVVWPVRFLKRAHFEPCISIKGAVAYCSKEDTRVDGPWEKGVLPEQGRRTDLEEAAKSYLESGERTFAEENPGVFIRNFRGLRELKKVMTFKDRTGGPVVEWRWGLTGSGKSYKPMRILHKDSHFVKDGTKWWNEYEQQEAIIIDDFDGKWEYRDFLRLLDIYKYQGEYKGGYIPINSPFIYITCEFPPSEFWEENALEQVLRRIKNSGGRIVHCWKDKDGYHETEQPIHLKTDSPSNRVTETPGNRVTGLELF